MMSNSKPLLLLENLISWYIEDNNIINIRNFEIDNHSIVGLVGRNGAGKTTLINVLSGVFDKYKAEKIWWQGTSITFQEKNFKKERYTVFTEEHGFSNWSFDQYIKLICKLYNKVYDQSEIQQLIDGFHFEKYRTKLIKDLSTGNKKKVFIITGLYLSCPLLILDEPLDGLDFDATEFLYSELNKYKEHGTVLMSSHIIESITRICDQVILLQNGHTKNIEIEENNISEVLVKKLMEEI